MLLDIIHLKKGAVLIKPKCGNSDKTAEIVEEIKDFMAKDKCHNIILDLTEINFLNCIKIGALASTYHFIEFMSGKIYLVVHDKQSQKSIEALNLSNAVIVFNQHKQILENIA